MKSYRYKINLSSNKVNMNLRYKNKMIKLIKIKNKYNNKSFQLTNVKIKCIY